MEHTCMLPIRVIRGGGIEACNKRAMRVGRGDAAVMHLRGEGGRAGGCMWGHCTCSLEW